MKGIAKRI